ncbi:MAG: SpoIID/LytB domain-containing protein [Armatimonadetes bacterium]|nr:SpoIID/LytB domain-containing protein [Armatimonadota bacterium]
MMQTNLRTLSIFVIGIAYLLASSSIAQKTGLGLEQLASVDFRNTPVQDAVQDLLSQAGFENWHIDEHTQGKITYKARSIPLRVVLSQVLRLARLTVDKKGDTILIHPPYEGYIRVGLDSLLGKPRSITVTSTTDFMVRDFLSLSCVRASKSQSVRITPKADQIEIQVENSEPLLFQPPIKILTEDGGIIQITDPRVRYGKYRGILEISGTSGLLIVNELPLEDYVKGVIPAEVDSRYHPEAQKALAVAIRTYALRAKMARRHTDYDVCATTHCQGFVGASQEAEWINEVVDKTRGQVILYDGQPIAAVYSTNCGGHTCSNETAGFGKDPCPYLRSVPDNPHRKASYNDNAVGIQNLAKDKQSVKVASASGIPSGNGDAIYLSVALSSTEDKRQAADCEDYCSAGKYHQWTRIFSPADLERIISKIDGALAGKLESIQFTDYDESGRVGTVIIKSRSNAEQAKKVANPTSNESETEVQTSVTTVETNEIQEELGRPHEYRMKGYQFRSLIGENVIMSTKMTLSINSDGQYVITGRGYGHGVGLCSDGADGMARTGKSYIEILKHYYTGVDITRSVSESP